MAQQSRVHAVDMSYLRGACGLTRWEDKNNESVLKGVAWELVQWIDV